LEQGRYKLQAPIAETRLALALLDGMETLARAADLDGDS
jgi:hypothetical protein